MQCTQSVLKQFPPATAFRLLYDTQCFIQKKGKSDFPGYLTDTSSKTKYLQVRHGAEQYTGDLEFVFYGYHLDRTILRIQRPYIV